MCDACRKLIGSSGLPLFWRVRVERFGIDSAIARVMGPDEDMTQTLMDTVTLTLCDPCGLAEDAIPVAALALMKSEAADEDAS